MEMRVAIGNPVLMAMERVDHRTHSSMVKERVDLAIIPPGWPN